MDRLTQIKPDLEHLNEHLLANEASFKHLMIVISKSMIKAE